MRTVYSLRERLRSEPEYVRAVQARTLDSKSPPGGLKGTYGLFGSAEWWENIKLNIAPVTRLTVIITGLYREGMDGDSTGFEMRSSDGAVIYNYTCISNRRADKGLYIVGKHIEISYVTEELKNPVPLGGAKASGEVKVTGFQTHSETIIESSIEE